MSNKGVLVLLLLLSLALSGCGKQRSNNSTLRSNEEIDFPEIYTEFNESYNGEVKKMDGFEGQTYYSYGLWGENSQYMHDTTIYLENNTLHTFLVFTNNMGKQFNCTLVIFDNYKQIDFEVDGKLMRQCTVSVENGTEIDIPITLSSLEEGKHDLVFAVFLNTYTELTDEERLGTGPSDGALRCLAVVGNKEEFPDAFNYLGVDRIEARTNGIVINKFNGNENFIEVGNLDEETESCAIIFMDNFEQINLLNTQSYPYDLVNLEPGKEIMIPVEEYLKNVSKDNKTHEIMAICIRKAGIEGDTFKGKVFFTYRLLNDAYIG